MVGEKIVTEALSLNLSDLINNEGNPTLNTMRAALDEAEASGIGPDVLLTKQYDHDNMTVLYTTWIQRDVTEMSIPDLTEFALSGNPVAIAELAERAGANA